MGKEQVLIYIDAKGVEHTALLVAKDQRHEGFVSLVYINGEVAQRLDSVAHESDPSKDEANPDLPRVALNCWKEAPAGVVSQTQLDMLQKSVDDYKAKLTADYNASVEEVSKVAQDLKAENDELKAKLLAKSAPSNADLDAQAAEQINTALELSEEQLDKYYAMLRPGIPSQADHLDAQAAEQKAKEATGLDANTASPDFVSTLKYQDEGTDPLTVAMASAQRPDDPKPAPSPDETPTA